MKLSEIRGERVFDVIADIIEPIAVIAEDEEAANLFKRERCPEGMTPEQFMLKKIRKSLPKLVKTHRDEICTILAVIADTSKEEYIKDVTMVSLLRDVMELLNDPEFTAFFS
jgi:hypothetical protein